MAIDETRLTKGLRRKLNALRKSVGDDLAEEVFAKWQVRKATSQAKGNPDLVAMKIVEALEGLENDPKFNLGNHGYTLRRPKGKGASGFIAYKNAIINLTRQASAPIYNGQEARMTTFYQFQKQFPDDEACLHHIMVKRYGGTEIDCPKCGAHGKFYRLTRDRAYLCQHCKHHIYPCAGTFMHRTRLPLHKWFYAMFLFTTTRHGVAAKELERQLDVSYPTAWRMGHLIRKHMTDTDGEWPLGGSGGGEVEADETYIGGRTTGGKRGRGAPNKTIVFGMIERDGDVMANVVPNVRKRTLQAFISENVEPGSTVHTDELKSYGGLATIGYTHQTVNHGAGEYVRGSCHVNGIEGFWARLKLSIRGTHVHVSRKHLQKYVKEFEFRYNRRKRPGTMFGDLVARF